MAQLNSTATVGPPGPAGPPGAQGPPGQSGSGGISNSPWVVSVYAESNNTVTNGQALLDGYQTIRDRAAISPPTPVNRYTLIVFPGVYQPMTPLLLDIPYTSMLSVTGPLDVLIILDDAQLVCKSQHVNIKGFELRGSGSSSANAAMRIACDMTGCVHEDLIFTFLTGGEGNIAMDFDDTIHSFHGVYRNVRGDCFQVYGGGRGLDYISSIGAGCDAYFENCWARGNSFGSSFAQTSQSFGTLLPNGMLRGCVIAPFPGSNLVTCGHMNLEIQGVADHCYFIGTDQPGRVSIIAFGDLGQMYYSTVINRMSLSANNKYAVQGKMNNTDTNARYTHCNFSATADHPKLHNKFGNLQQAFCVEDVDLNLTQQPA